MPDIGDHVYHVTIDSYFAYLAVCTSDNDNEGLSIYNIENPADPVKTDSYSISCPWGICYHEHYAYLTEFENARLTVFDVSDPANIVLAERYNTPPGSGPYYAHVDNDYVYIACGLNGLQILENIL